VNGGGGGVGGCGGQGGTGGTAGGSSIALLIFGSQVLLEGGGLATADAGAGGDGGLGEVGQAGAAGGAPKIYDGFTGTYTTHQAIIDARCYNQIAAGGDGGDGGDGSDGGGGAGGLSVGVLWSGQAPTVAAAAPAAPLFNLGEPGPGGTGSLAGPVGLGGQVVEAAGNAFE
jgi:hypothetical protein